MPLPNLTPLVSPTWAGDQKPAATLPSVVATAQFNVYAREQFRTHALAYGRRDYYKISLITGRSRYSYATRGVLIDRPALVFSNPLIPYSWEPISEEQGGYMCLFTEQFLIVNDRAASLQESPLFRLGSDPVYFLNDTRYADLSLPVCQNVAGNEFGLPLPAGSGAQLLEPDCLRSPEAPAAGHILPAPRRVQPYRRAVSGAAGAAVSPSTRPARD